MCSGAEVGEPAQGAQAGHEAVLAAPVDDEVGQPGQATADRPLRDGELTAVLHADQRVPLVGGADEPVIVLNEEAMAQMRTEVRLEIIPGATHLFEEPGALDEVARLASDWFTRHFRETTRSSTILDGVGPHEA